MVVICKPFTTVIDTDIQQSLELMYIIREPFTTQRNKMGAMGVNGGNLRAIHNYMRMKGRGLLSVSDSNLRAIHNVSRPWMHQ